jgi:hypothetical protein
VQQDEFVDVATSDSLPAAQAAVASLRAAGIDARLRETDTPEGGETSESVVMVPAGQAAAAMDLLRDAASPEVDEDAAAASGDSAPAPTTEVSAEAIDKGLARIRRRRRLTWFWFFSYIPAALLVTVAGPESLVAPVALCWMAAYLLSGALAVRTSCPRCGKRYCRDEQRWDPYTQRCLNCQLPLGDLGHSSGPP